MSPEFLGSGPPAETRAALSWYPDQAELKSAGLRMADKIAFQGLPFVGAPAPGKVAATPGAELEEYVVTDGLPMADSDVQALTMRDAHSVLDHYFHHVLSDPNVYVAMDTMVHYERGSWEKHLAPDVMVVLGVPGKLRDSYQVWEEGGRAPDFVLEVLSRTTHLRDQQDKRAKYASIGVREYFQYDPKGTTLARRTGRRLLGERLVDGRWERLERLGEERIHSEVLGLELRVKRREKEPGYRELRFRDPSTGEDLRTHSEAEARADREAARADREAARADAAERENAALKALLAAWGGGGPSNPADGS